MPSSLSLENRVDRPSPLASHAHAPRMGPVSHDRFDISWRPLLARLLGAGRAAGADFVEFFLERRNYLSCVVENGRVSSVSPALSAGAGVRIFKGMNDCYVSTNDLSEAGLSWALDRALGILGLSVPRAGALVPDVNLEPLRDYAAMLKKESWLDESLGITPSCDVLMKFNALTLNKTSHAQSATSSCFRDWQEILVAASDGIFARDIRLTQSLSGNVSCVDGAHRAALSERLGHTGRPAFLIEADLDAMAETLARAAGNMLHADFVSAGDYPVVMANRFGGVIFHEACGHLLETTQLRRKITPFEGKVGQKIAHENLTAWDEGLTSDAFGTIDMDDEGMPAQRTLLIENGILRNFISDRGGFLHTGQPRTGSGRRQNYAFAAASRMRNTFIAGGTHTPGDLIASIDKGLYCKKMGGGSVGATGEFNFGVEEAYLIEGGKLTKPVKGATLIGEAVQIMNEISMCANDTELAAGFCGSVSGSVYVTVGQPHIKVNHITVGGR